MEIMTTIIAYLTSIFTFSKIKTFLAICIGLVGMLCGGYTIIVKGLFLGLVLDFLFGFTNAWRENKLSKKKFKEGLLKIWAYAMTLIVLNNADNIIGVSIYGFGITEFGASYLGVYETISCLKHLKRMGVPIPKKLIEKLEDFNDNLEFKTLEGKP